MDDRKYPPKDDMMDDWMHCPAKPKPGCPPMPECGPGPGPGPGYGYGMCPFIVAMKCIIPMIKPYCSDYPMMHPAMYPMMPKGMPCMDYLEDRQQEE
ncbi:MAG: hypothetical protein PHP06_04080 [Clostridia bacterium]|nr:hypothetical protein [Clostridia bacterium]